jgi:hypothetical protein
MVECTYNVEATEVERVHTVRSNKELDEVTYDADTIVAYSTIIDAHLIETRRTRLTRDRRTAECMQVSERHM